MKTLPEIKVLAECVDIRSGARFFPGDSFSPLPTEDQAKRLVAGRCLPESAVEIAKANDAAMAKEKDKLGAEEKKRLAATALITSANAELAEARSEADAAQSAFDAATEDDKTVAASALKQANERLAAAEDEVKKLSK